MTYLTRTFSGARNILAVFVFVSATLLGIAGLAACDSGSTDALPPTSAVPAGATQASGGADGIQRGQAVFARYCNACHPGGGRGAGPALVGRVAGLSDTEFTGLVRHGKERMPAFTTAQISDPE